MCGRFQQVATEEESQEVVMGLMPTGCRDGSDVCQVMYRLVWFRMDRERLQM